MLLNKKIYLFTILSIPVLLSSLNGLGSYLSFGILSTIFGIFLVNHLAAKFQVRLILIVAFISIYIFTGYGNQAWLIDTRITLTNLMLFFVLKWCLKHQSLDRIIGIIYFLNFSSFLIFTSIYLGWFPNLYFDDILATYHDYKFIANPLFLFYILPFLYSLIEKRPDKTFFLNFFLGLIVGLLSGSLQTLVLLILTHGLVLLDIKKISFSRIFLILLVAIVFIFSMNYVDVRFIDKIGYVFKPLESSTIQTRIGDLLYIWPEATASIEKIIFGSGIGIRSIVYRFNDSNPALSEYRTFLEIDNGFFYIFHRYGLIGFSLFLYVHKKLFQQINGFNPKIMFLIIVVITNILSIHYWSHYIFPILTALILSLNYETQKQNNPL